MPLLPRRVRVPVAVADACLRPGERVLAFARAADGTWLVGTRDHLHTVRGVEDAGGTGAAGVVSFAWEQVQRADWDKDAGVLRLERVEAYGDPVTPLVLELPEPADLLPLVRERVTASVVLQRRVEVSRRRGFSVIGRRPPSGAGEVTWAYEFDAGVDPADPAVSAAAEAALREARESLGL